MASASKLLLAMFADRDSRGYTYQDAVRVLLWLGFEPARTKPKGSHRLWRHLVTGSGGNRSVYVGLVDKGHGTLKPVYVRKMLDVLLQNGLTPAQD